MSTPKEAVHKRTRMREDWDNISEGDRFMLLAFIRAQHKTKMQEVCEEIESLKPEDDQKKNRIT